MIFVGDVISGGPTEFHWKPPSYNQVATLPSYEQAINGANETEVAGNGEPDMMTSQSVSEPDMTTIYSVSSPEVYREDSESGVTSGSSHTDQEVANNGAHLRTELGGGSLERRTPGRQQNSQSDQPGVHSAVANQGVDNNAFVDDVIQNEENCPKAEIRTTDKTSRDMTSDSDRNTSSSE